MTLALRWKICIGQNFFLTAGKRCSTDYSTQRQNKLLEMPTSFLKLEIIAACSIWEVQIRKKRGTSSVVSRRSSAKPKSRRCLFPFWFDFLRASVLQNRNVLADDRRPTTDDGRHLTFITSNLGSVMSSIAYRKPSRPRPESFTPPYGMWSMRKLGTSPAITPPTSSSSNA